MALFSTFGEILTQTRLEARLSADPAVSPDANMRYKQIVNSTYATLFDNYDWPHLVNYAAPRVTLQAGSRHYNFPAGLDHQHINSAAVWWNDHPYNLNPGIGFDEYSAFDPTADERNDPAQRYALHAPGDGSIQFEIWPLPASTGPQVQFIGRRRRYKLVNAGDICLLDDDLVALHAAAVIARPISKDLADDLAARAATQLRQLRGRAVLPQTDSDGAPAVGSGESRARFTDGKVVVHIGGS